MLRTLYIENILLIERAEINFQSGFSVITGQTGAGKSILFDAISLVFGERLKNRIVPTGKRGVIMATFNSKNQQLLKVLEENDITCHENEIILKRTITDEGVSKMYICDTPCSANLITKIADFLIEIHNQTSSLRNKSSISWIGMLDRYLGLGDQLKEMHRLYQRRRQLLLRIEDLKNGINTESMEHLAQMVKDVEILKLQENEEDSLIELKNTKKAEFEMSKGLSQALSIIEENKIEQSVNKLVVAFHKLQGIGSEVVQQSIEGFKLICEKFSIDVNFIKDEVYKMTNKASGAMSDFEKIEERLFEIKSLARKYNVLPNLLKEMSTNAELKLKSVASSKLEIDSLMSEESLLYGQILSLAKEVSSKRQDATSKFASTIKKQMKDLMLDNAQVEMKVESSESLLSASGIDHVSLLASLNPGMPMQEVDKIASGGELSRLILSILVATTEARDRPTILFDEIDTGISGSIAGAMGRKMREIAPQTQVIAITHNHQVACCAPEHIHIYKEAKGDRAITIIKHLSHQERVDEIAKMMSSSENQVHLREVAEKMLLDN